jgi:hypothetical protein
MSNSPDAHCIYTASHLYLFISLPSLLWAGRHDRTRLAGAVFRDGPV